MLRHWTSLSALLLVSVGLNVLAGCDKKDATPPTTEPSASAAAVASSAPSASASASAAPSASASESASAAPEAAAPAPTDASAPKASAAASGSAAPAPSGSAKVFTCGKKPLPDCPLQGWMKANVNPAMAASDTPKLGEALEKIAKLGPPGYPNWVSISMDGAKAARSGNLDGAKASCRTCHDQYKAKYRNELRDRKL